MEENKMKDITVYSTPTCPYCVMAKHYLKEKGHEFEDIDISADPARAQEMMRKSGQMGVPVLDIAGEVVIGFNKPKIEELLKK